ncbi:TIGR02270 family protein [Sorangium sp. So ce861]|uniref:TIGR02270 family protein n=1 Tax=Sorangium sp. So ce861 TaxID=3133323 RepID=UPI003F61976A
MILDIDAEVIEQHAREADFLWSTRDIAVRTATYTLRRLCELDERVEANLDGLRLAGDAGWEVCKVLLDDPDAEAGAVFTAAAVAVDRGDLPGVAQVLDAGGAIPGVARGIVSALGWLPFEQVRRLLPGLLDGECPPELHYLGIAACAVHRHDPGTPLSYAMCAGDPRLRARALRAAGELGRADLLPELRGCLRDADEACRFAAAWSAALFGEPAAAHTLWEFATQGGPMAPRAVDVAMRRMAPAVAYTWLHELSRAHGSSRAAIAGAAALGDPASVPWLLERAEEPAWARAAGAAFSTLTGVDLRAERLEQRAPVGAGPSEDPDADDVAMDPDEGLPWPDAAALRRAWDRMAPRFKRQMRYLMGQPLEPAWLEGVLRQGPQPARAAAALELSIREPRRMMFEVRAPGFRQRRKLAGR